MAMMTKMREKTHIVLGFLLVAFLALIVVEWGSESTIFRSKEMSGIIASINGHDIHYEQFVRAYEHRSRRKTNSIIFAIRCGKTWCAKCW
jgi:hypothetical protein